MKTFKIIVFTLITVVIFYLSLQLVLFLFERLNAGGLYNYWLIEPLIAVSLVAIVKHRYFRDEPLRMIIIGFGINLMVMSAIGYEIWRNITPNGFFINLAFLIYFMSSVSTLILSIIYTVILWVLNRKKEKVEICKH